MSNTDHRKIDNIFSEDVKDPSLFVIQSSDDEDDEGCRTPPTPERDKASLRVPMAPGDIISDKISRQTKLDDDLYDHTLNTDGILNEINNFFEQSVASLLAEETRQLHRDTSFASRSDAEDDLEVVVDPVGVVLKATRRRRNPRGRSAAQLIHPERRVQKRTKRRDFEDTCAQNSRESDEDYVPDDYDPIYDRCERSKRKSTRRGRESNTQNRDLLLQQLRNLRYSKDRRERGHGENSHVSKDIVPAPEAFVSRNQIVGHDWNINRHLSQTDATAMGDNVVSHALQDDDVWQVPNEPGSTHRVDCGDEHAEHSQQFCLKFVILDETRSIIKDSRLERVFVKRNETLGNLAVKFGKLFNLDEHKHKDVQIYIDGDPQPHSMTIGDEMLEIEDGMQVDIRFPPKPLPDIQDDHPKYTKRGEKNLTNIPGSTASATGASTVNIQIAAEPRRLIEEVIEID